MRAAAPTPPVPVPSTSAISIGPMTAHRITASPPQSKSSRPCGFHHTLKTAGGDRAEPRIAGAASPLGMPDLLEMALEEVPGAGPVKLMAARKEVDVEPV